MGENNQQSFINEVELKKILYSKKFMIPEVQIRNWDVSFSAMMDTAIYEINAAVMAEEKIENIDVIIKYSLWDHIKDIIKHFKFDIEIIKTINIKQLILYPSLDIRPNIHKITYKVYNGKVI